MIEPPVEADMGQVEKDLNEAVHFSVNQNKKKLKLNLKSAKGREIFFRLAKRADVVIEGFRPGVAKRLGIDHKEVELASPRTIYCSISNYGQNGPYRDLVAHDINVVGLSGLLDVTGSREGPPVLPGTTVGDIGGALLATVSILAALMTREKTGRGQYIDVSLLEATIPFMTLPIGLYLCGHIKSGRGETWSNGGFPGYNVYETRDGKYITIGATQKKNWLNLCRAIGREDFADSQLAEGDEQRQIFSFLKDLFKSKDLSHWEAYLKDRGIGFAPVRSIEEVLNDVHLRERGVIRGVDGPAKLSNAPASPVKMQADSSERPSTSPPVGGSQASSILREIGYDENEITEFTRNGVI